jgi:hypothetical protein
MHRALIGACIGVAFGMIALAGFGVWWGFTHGVESRQPNLPPGWEAAWTSAFVFTAYFWWLAGGIGAVIGGLAGFGSWVVRSRRTALHA